MTRHPLYSVIVFLFSTTLAVALINGCTPYALRTHDCGAHANRSFKEYSDYLNTCKISKGYGTLEMSIDGERLRSDFDMKTSMDSTVSLNLYAMFGNEIAAMRFSPDSCHITLQNRIIHLSASQSLDTLGYPWADVFSVSEFVTSLRGVIPDEFLAHDFLCGTVQRHFMSSEITFQDKLNLRKLRFLLRFNRLVRIVLDYSAQGDSFLITQSRFQNGIPRKIVLKKDDKNYCKVVYHKILTP